LGTTPELLAGNYLAAGAGEAVGEGVAVEGGKGAAAPGDDRGVDLGDHHLRTAGEDVERGAQGEAEAEAADQHARRGDRRFGVPLSP